jgi:hypothetical protein
MQTLLTRPLTGGTSRFPQALSTGPLARTGGFTAGVDIEIKL